MNLSQNRIPKRLNPDNLTDAIIVIGYKADYSKQFLEKMMGWSVAIKGIHNLEQQKGVAVGSLTYNDYYTQINEVLRQSIFKYMTSH